MKIENRINAARTFVRLDLVEAIEAALAECDNLTKDNYIATYRKAASAHLKKIGGTLTVVRVYRIIVRDEEVELLSEVSLEGKDYLVLSHIVLPRAYKAEVTHVKEIM